MMSSRMLGHQRRLWVHTSAI